MSVPLSVSKQPAAGDGDAAGPLHVLALDPAGVREELLGHEQPAYRAKQVLEWVYRKRATEFEAMSSLSKAMRQQLAERAAIYVGRELEIADAADGTRKLLLGLPDGESVECVWIPGEGRETACLSSQVGCPVGCRFCASGLDGVKRNLTAGEIVEQAMRIESYIVAATPEDAERPGRLSNIVMMGMGEPLANYDQVLRAIRTLNAEWGMNIGARKITISTVGLPKQIRALARENLQLNLALSLHSPREHQRAELIPWARGIKLDDLLDACADYFSQTGREITLEYVLLDDVNNSSHDADALARIAKRLRANVNLLRYNPVPGLPYRRPDAESSHAFQRRLREAGVNAHVRRSRGSDVAAACGQLRRSVRERTE